MTSSSTMNWCSLSGFLRGATARNLRLTGACFKACAFEYKKAAHFGRAYLFARTLAPAMRRPVPDKNVFLFPCVLLSFSRSAKPPLSPPFHPHSYVSGFLSVQVGCSRFSRRCYLVSVLCFSSQRSLGPGVGRSRLIWIDLSITFFRLLSSTSFLLSVFPQKAARVAVEAAIA